VCAWNFAEVFIEEKATVYHDLARYDKVDKYGAQARRRLVE